MSNALTVTTIIVGLLEQATKAGMLLRQAAVEGRDLTTAEVDQVFADDAAMRAQLQAQIDAAKAAGG